MASFIIYFIIGFALGTKESETVILNSRHLIELANWGLAGHGLRMSADHTTPVDSATRHPTECVYALTADAMLVLPPITDAPHRIGDNTIACLISLRKTHVVQIVL